jgi:hypothetical protein
MPKRLRNIRLDEISLVDDPANQGAQVTLYKRDHEYSAGGEDADRTDAGSPGTTTSNDGGLTMTPQELEKRLGELEGQNAELQKSVDAAQAKADAIEKAATDAGLTVQKDDDGNVSVTKAADEYVEIDGERVHKGSVPERLLKRLQTLEAERESDRLAKRAHSEVPNLAGTDVQKGRLLKAIDEMPDEDREAMAQALKAADAAVKRAFDEVGRQPAEDESSATYKLNKRVGEFQSEQGYKTREQAYADFVCTGEGASLLAESQKEAR